MRGYDTAELGGGFADQVLAAQWFWSVRSPSIVANHLLSVNGSPYSAFNNPTGVFSHFSVGDVIICEDAGDVPQPFNPDDYLATWTARLTAAVATGARVVALTMYDTSQSAWQAMGYNAAPADSRFDVVAVGSPSGISRSPNDCIRDAAAATGAEVYDFGADALTFAQWCYGQYLLKIVNNDGVHNRLWLGIKMTYGILKHLGLATLYVPSQHLLEAIVVPNWSTGSPNIGYGSPYWSQGACDAVLAQACS